ncbi:hypothetical protein Tco_1528822, partial [Tanacetum coccineum]
GLTVIVRELPIINMAELVRLQIYEEIEDTWAWVAPGPERQPDATAGAPGAIEDTLAVDEGAQADPAPVHAPQPPTPPPAVDHGGSGQTYRRLMRPLEGAPQQPSRDALDIGPMSPTLPQPRSSQTHDPSTTYLLTKPGSKFSTIAR